MPTPASALSWLVKITSTGQCWGRDGVYSTSTLALSFQRRRQTEEDSKQLLGVSRPRMYLALVCHYMILAQVNAGTGAPLSDSDTKTDEWMAVTRRHKKT